MYKSYDLTDGHEPVSHAEINYLADLAKMLPVSPLIVNIGAADGVSTCTFLEICQNPSVYSIDVNECKEEKENAERLGFNPTRIIRLLGRSEEIGSSFPYKCDMLFVDGGHYNAGNDTDVWWDKIRVGGILAFHDYLEETPPNNLGAVFADLEKRMEFILSKFDKMGRVERVVAFRRKKDD